ncbi:MAG: hypothetical protein WA956_05705 [Stenotrophomonas sp.]
MAKKPAPEQPASESKRGAKPLPDADIVGDQADDSAEAARHGELVVMNDHQQALVNQFGDGLPWHPDHYEAAIRIEIGRSAESFLRAGRMLLVARACCIHGEWGGMLKRLNLGETTALHMMAWARQVQGLANPARVQDLQAAASTIGKMIELSRLPEEQFKALAEEGRTGELELDDVASMTRDELRAAVREARADLEAKDQRINKLSDDLNREHEKTTKAQRRWKAADSDQQLVILKQSVTEAEQMVAAALGGEKSGLRAAVRALAAHASDNGQDNDAATFISDMIGRLLNSVRIVRDDEDLLIAIPLVNDGEEG